MDLIDNTFFRAAAAAALTLLVAQGIPRALNRMYRWTSSMLFSSLSGSRKLSAMLFSAASLLWVLVFIQAVYSPVAILTPRILPYPDGLIRTIIVVEIWVLMIALPFLMGVVQAYLSKGTILYRLSMFPRSFVHVFGITLALFTLIPWIIWRYVIGLRMRRLKDDQLVIEIEAHQYATIADWLIAGLKSVGLSAESAPLPGPVRLSRWFLHRFGPPILRPKAEYVARRIVGDGYSLMIFDGLIDVVAERGLRNRIRLGLIGRLPPDGLWLTRSDAAREIEHAIRSGGPALDTVPKLMQEADLSLEEWRILSWEYLQVLIEKSGVVAGVSESTTGHEPTVEAARSDAPPASAEKRPQRARVVE